MASGLTVYHNPRCRKSRETLALLDEKGVQYTVIEYLKQPLSRQTLTELVAALDMPAEQLVRRGEEIFKLNYKNKSLSEAQWIAVLAQNPILIERPIVVKGTKAMIGRPPENVLNLL